ncbi:MFS transporter [Streptomyces halstedii]|uniref:MFS transporter n=1 Tax=Streptomyces halstedii TaxID=1944 RepID=UPI00339F23FD
MARIPEAISPTESRSFRNFKIVWLGQLLSSIGSPFQSIAVAIWFLETGRGASALAAVLAAGTISQLIGTLFSGPLVDRRGALSIILHTDIIRCALAGLLAVALFLDCNTVLIVALVSISGVVGGIFLPALRSAPGVLLSEEDRPRGNSLMEVSNSTSMLVGALAGGMTVALVGPIPAITFNGASYAIGALCAALMKRRSAIASTMTTTDSMASLVREGVAFVWRTGWLRTLLVVDATLDLVTAGQLSIGLPAISRQLTGASSLGFMIAGFGAGSLIGAILAVRLPKMPLLPIRMVYLLQLLAAPFLGVLPLINLPAAIACLAAAGILNAIASVQYISIIQRNVDSAMLGRVMALLVAAGLSVQPVGQVLCGILIENGWMRESFAVGAIVMMLVCVLGLTRRNLGKLA